MSDPAPITVNGRPQPVPPGATVAGVAAGHGLEAGRRGVAVALNGRVVPARLWAETPVAPGDTLELVHALQGG
ncbi:sulfur carrier protein ThiS [Azospirillum halopraeferens]|uniref:sulfur carrier protein ThiS n=1 Tax=Azospirillum halopraeferens TaxID=34010 RepID=UPI0004002E29|nr:sulfur carrier protein ThiS [Azospirillum halopraeferens]